VVCAIVRAELVKIPTRQCDRRALRPRNDRSCAGNDAAAGFGFSSAPGSSATRPAGFFSGSLCPRCEADIMRGGFFFLEACCRHVRRLDGGAAAQAPEIAVAGAIDDNVGALSLPPRPWSRPQAR